MNCKIVLLLSSIILSTFTVFADEYQIKDLKDFYTDGCSKFFDGADMLRWRNRKSSPIANKWLHCCVEHDIAYYMGGTVVDRDMSDLRLKKCVAGLKYSKTAFLMNLGVWFGGSARFKTSFRWGYGWPYGRGYQSLKTRERKMIFQKLINYKCHENISKLTTDREQQDLICHIIRLEAAILISWQ